MRFTTTASIIALVAGLAPSARAILVAKGSQCSSKCGNVLSSTGEDDLVCGEAEYSSSNGAVFKNCVGCEMSSTYQTPSTEYDNNAETDTQWMLCMFDPLPFLRNFGNHPRLLAMGWP